MSKLPLPYIDLPRLSYRVTNNYIHVLLPPLILMNLNREFNVASADPSMVDI